MNFIQRDNARLGNTIQATPVLQALAEKIGPIPSYFETEYVKECFKDAPFLKILREEPQETPVLESTSYKRRNYSQPDYEYLWTKYKKVFGLSGEMPHTYVDKVEMDFGSEFVAISNGCGNYENPEYWQSKIIDQGTWEGLLSEIGESKMIYGVASDQDLAFLPKTDATAYRNIRKSLAVLNKAEYVITNEGGIYHCAVALKRPTFVIWKNTLHPKNCAPGGYISRGDHLENFRQWDLFRWKK